jgi:hypothetical protein
MTNFFRQLTGTLALVWRNLYGEGNTLCAEAKPKIKICKDCLYCQSNELFSVDYSVCIHPKTQHPPSLVTGKNFESYCNTSRNFYGPCGPNGRYWTPKETEQT